MVLILGPQLELTRCPHCSIALPNLRAIWATKTKSASENLIRNWKAYHCASCGGLVVAASDNGEIVTEIYPESSGDIDEAIPVQAAKYLTQALETMHAPAGSVMLSASAVDAMLKAKNLTEGNLYPRIQEAADSNLITAEMAKWAHEIRLDANDQRHADQNAPLPSEADAQRVVEFALALAQFLFVLPSRVKRGLESSKGSQ